RLLPKRQRWFRFILGDGHVTVGLHVTFKRDYFPMQRVGLLAPEVGFPGAGFHAAAIQRSIRIDQNTHQPPMLFSGCLGLGIMTLAIGVDDLFGERVLLEPVAPDIRVAIYLPKEQLAGK